MRQKEKTCAGHRSHGEAVDIKDGGCGSLCGGDGRVGFSSGWANGVWIEEQVVAGWRRKTKENKIFTLGIVPSASSSKPEEGALRWEDGPSGEFREARSGSTSKKIGL